MEEFKRGDRVGDFVVKYEVGTFRYVVSCGCDYIYVRSGKDLHKRSHILCKDCQDGKNVRK